MTILSKVTLANANSAQTVVYFFLLMLHKAKYPKVNYFDYALLLFFLFKTILCFDLSVTCDRSVVFSGSSGFLHQ